MKMPQRRARRWQQPIAKHCKTEGEFIKDCVMKMVKEICPEKKQEEFADVSMAWSTASGRIEDVSSDIKRQFEVKGMDFDFFFSFFVSLRQKHQYWFFFCLRDDKKLQWNKTTGIITDRRTCHGWWEKWTINPCL